jgi:hypothetical protein
MWIATETAALSRSGFGILPPLDFSLLTDHGAMHVLYEESGAFKVGTILAATDASLQVEAPHGKRSKVKSNAVLLRFDSPGAAQLMEEAETLAAGVDIDFLWECSGQRIGFDLGARIWARLVKRPAS